MYADGYCIAHVIKQFSFMNEWLYVKNTNV